MEEVLDVEDICDEERLEGLFCGVVKYFYGNRFKLDLVVYFIFMYLVKIKVLMFNSDVII